MDGVTPVIISGEVKYIRARINKKIRMVPLLGTEFNKALWTACAQYGRWQDWSVQQVLTYYYTTRREILRRLS